MPNLKTCWMPKNNDCTTRNLLDYSYHQNYYKVISINLSRQTNTSIPQWMNFAEKLEDYGATMFFITEKPQKTSFSFDSFIITQ